LYMSDGTAPFAAYGVQEPLFINSVQVVKKGTARRIYETGVLSDTMTNKVTYSVRVSDDEAKTFTSNTVDVTMFGMMDQYASFSIVAIDPTNPDRIIGRVKRDTDTTSTDSMLESVDAGKTFRHVMELGDFAAAAFTPDGKLYFGDNDQDQRKFYVMDKAGGDPQMIGSGWKVGCLSWDDSKKRMLACYDFRFGTADLEKGTFNLSLDMRCAGSFVECPGATTSSADACKAQLLAAYCGYGHYPAAPLCMPYDTGPEAAEMVSSAGYSCTDGMVTGSVGDPPGSGTNGQALTGGTTGSTAGSGADAGAAGSSPSTAGSGATTAANGGSSATTTGSAGSTTSAPAPAKSSGCSCALAGSRGRDSSAAWLFGVFGMLGYAVYRRRRSR
jgi:MYXO-CTERM domain-containing protein